MIVKTRLMTAVAAAALLVPSVGLSTVVPAADADAGPRAAPATHGHFGFAYFVKLKVVSQHGSGDKKGDRIERDYYFRPTCGRGDCATDFDRTYGSDDENPEHVRYTIRPDKRGVYAGRHTELSSCYLKHKTIKKAYHRSEQVTITPDRVGDGQIETFTGTLTLSFEAKKPAAEQGCTPSSEKLTLRGSLEPTGG